MSVPMLLVPAERLIKIVRSILVSVGMSAEDSAIAADVLVETDARGVSSHGIVALPSYVRQMREGGSDPRAKVAVVRESGGTCLIDGRYGMGQVVSVRATRKLIELAEEYGVSVVCVKNSNHFGAGAYYAMMCAAAGQIGFAISNATPVLVAPGGRGPAVGNNPVAIAVPTADGAPIVLDMALSVVAVGKMINIANSGGVMPSDWLVDENGRPSLDVHVLSRGGAVFPFGGYKGYGLAVMAEILSSVLPGAGVTKELRDFILHPDQRALQGHFFLSIDVSRFQELGTFEARVSSLGRELREGGRAEGTERLFMPGDMENDTQHRSAENGVAIPEHGWKGLVRLAGEQKLDLDMSL